MQSSEEKLNPYVVQKVMNHRLSAPPKSWWRKSMTD